MGKNNEQFMDLNRETAMRLWNKSFGKETKVNDFAGRTIAKGAYNDRNSEFGWNVDHILPQSKGGVTADYNLICCHINTNDEKANKFPCFTANEIPFEIVKVQNHYEIRTKSKKHVDGKPMDNKTDEIDLYDTASSIRFLKKRKGVQNENIFVGSVFIQLNGVTNTAIVDFIEEIFDTENISFDKLENQQYFVRNSNSMNINMVVRDYMPLKDDISMLLDKCILLNTYLGHYFLPTGYINKYCVYFCVDCFKNKASIFDNLRTRPSGNIVWAYIDQNKYNTLFINTLVLENTEAGSKIERNIRTEYNEYNYIFTNISKNLDKEVEGK